MDTPSQTTYEAPVSWKNLTSPSNEKVEIPQLKQKFQQIIDSTFKPSQTGRGKDNREQIVYTGVQIRKVERIENSKLWSFYNYNRKIFDASGLPVLPKLGVVPSRELRKELNEVYLFHGPALEWVDPICNEGLDPRIVRQGKYGTGLYFADDFMKVDQYCQTFEGELSFFVCRVLLGHIDVVSETSDAIKQMRRPARIYPAHPTNIRRYDSIMRDKDRGNPTVNYNEFVVFDRLQVYPEFLVTYQRTGVDREASLLLRRLRTTNHLLVADPVYKPLFSLQEQKWIALCFTLGPIYLVTWFPRHLCELFAPNHLATCVWIKNTIEDLGVSSDGFCFPGTLDYYTTLGKCIIAQNDWQTYGPTIHSYFSSMGTISFFCANDGWAICESRPDLEEVVGRKQEEHVFGHFKIMEENWPALKFLIKDAVFHELHDELMIMSHKGRKQIRLAVVHPLLNKMMEIVTRLQFPSIYQS